MQLLLNSKKDNIISIVKSLRPIKYLYSKQNKDFDRYFRGSNLKDFVKQIKSQKKHNTFLNPGENMSEFTNKNKGSIDFKSTFNYLEELSILKKLPFSNLKRAVVKSSRFNSENNKRKNNKGKKIIIKPFKNNGDADVTLDPGRYNPKYDYIKRRYPCAYLGKPKKDDDSYLDTLIEQEDNKDNYVKKYNKNKNINLDTNDEISTNLKTNLNTNVKNGKKTKKIFKSFSNRLIYENQKKEPKYKKIDLLTAQSNKILEKDKYKKIKLTTQVKLNTKSTFSLLKEQNTASSFNNANDHDNAKREKFKSKSTNHKLGSHLYNTQRAFRNKKNDLIKKLSCENIKCPIMFNKMQGRDRSINFVEGSKDSQRVTYNPDYNYIRPHVRSTIFKSKREFQDIKKYVTNKIIRSYYINPEQYFIFEYNKSKEDEMAGNFGAIFLNIS